MKSLFESDWLKYMMDSLTCHAWSQYLTTNLTHACMHHRVSRSQIRHWSKPIKDHVSIQRYFLVYYFKKSNFVLISFPCVIWFPWWWPRFGSYYACLALMSAWCSKTKPHSSEWVWCIMQAGISNYIPQFTAGCNYLSLPEIPASGNKIWVCVSVVCVLFVFVCVRVLMCVSRKPLLD